MYYGLSTVNCGHFFCQLSTAHLIGSQTLFSLACGEKANNHSTRINLVSNFVILDSFLVIRLFH
jgi:hypothetical protein